MRTNPLQHIDNNIIVTQEKYKAILPYLITIIIKFGILTFATWCFITLFSVSNLENVNYAVVLLFGMALLTICYNLFTIYKLVTSNLMYKIIIDYDKMEYCVLYFKLYKFFEKKENSVVIPFNSYKMRFRYYPLRDGLTKEIIVNYNNNNYSIDGRRIWLENFEIIKEEFTKYSSNKGKIIFKDLFW